MEEQEYSQYCYQNRTSSCRKSSISTSIYITLYIIFSLISAVTVFLNLLVIISISLFKQLHTPSNLLILSLAVSDLLVGLFVIPAVTAGIIEQCWILGDYYCVLLLYITFLCESSSIGNLILISIDRYVAVCDPLMYNLKITTTRTAYFILITWCCGIIYDAAILKSYVNVHVQSSCFEECYLLEGHFWVSVLDFVISMVIPSSIIITLYFKIFVVARSQARQIFSKNTARSAGDKPIQANKSETKAAKTLGVVVFNYILFWNPVIFIISSFSNNNSASLILTFLPCINSFINPVIYAFFYPWFKMTAKHILTLKLKNLNM